MAGFAIRLDVECLRCGRSRELPGREDTVRLLEESREDGAMYLQVLEPCAQCRGQVLRLRFGADIAG